MKNTVWILDKIIMGLVVSNLLFIASCSDDKDGNHDSGHCDNCGQSGNQGIKATADLTGAFGLLVLDETDNGVGLNLAKKHNERVEKLGLSAPIFDLGQEGLSLLGSKDGGKANSLITSDGSIFTFPGIDNGLGLLSSSDSAAMQKIDKDTGEIKDALTQEVDESDPNAFNHHQKLPKLSTIAVSGKGDVFLHFEQSFIYKDADHNEDPWNPSNGFQCQIFKVKGGTLDDLLTQDPSRDNLECIDNTHFIDSWRSFNNGVFQFDSDGSIYYPGSIPNTSKMVVYKQSRDLSSTEEVINANICVEDFLITESGGVFYTGQTCQNDGGHGGGHNGGFFRYIAPGSGGEIIEIARDWYNFIFDTAVSEDETDTAVFFGPDPRNANTASWDSACLFQFDPSQSDPTSRISEVITCGNNIWDWMEMTRSVDVDTYGEGYHNYTGTDNNFSPTIAWKKEYEARCTSNKEVFAGGGSQISAIQQDSTGKIYVIGNIRKKQEGSLTCSVDFRGPHCSINGMPALNNSAGVAYTSSTCAADSGLWINKGRCSDGTTDVSCIDHSRTWTPGFCSSPNYTTKAACEAATGCWDNWNQTQAACESDNHTWGNFIWQTGRCSTDDQRYRTQSTCEAQGYVWQNDDWAGSCTSSDSEDNAGVHDNNYNACIPEWQTESVWYDNVSTSLCTDEENGDANSWHDWDHKNNNFAKTESSTRSKYSDLKGTFLVNRFQCNQVNGSGGDWTTEYSALAVVNPEKKNLDLLSLESEKAIDLWLVNDNPYYSSFDTNLGQYLLNGLESRESCIDNSKTSESSCSGDNLVWSERKCVNSSYSTEASCEDASLSWQTSHPLKIIENFETYNLAESGVEGEMFADGLDFGSNSYKFGTINVENKSLLLKKGLTGTVKTIVILPE